MITIWLSDVHHGAELLSKAYSFNLRYQRWESLKFSSIVLLKVPYALSWPIDPSKDKLLVSEKNTSRKRA